MLFYHVTGRGKGGDYRAPRGRGNPTFFINSDSNYLNDLNLLAITLSKEVGYPQSRMVSIGLGLLINQKLSASLLKF